MEKMMYSVNEFCDNYSVSRAQVTKMVAAGELRAVKMGRRVLIHRKDAEEWADNLVEANKTTRVGINK